MTILSCATLKQLWKCGWCISGTKAANAKSQKQKCDQQCCGEGNVLGSGHIILISFHEIGSSSVGIWSHRASPCQSVVSLLGKQSRGEDDPSDTCRGVE